MSVTGRCRVKDGSWFLGRKKHTYQPAQHLSHRSKIRATLYNQLARQISSKICRAIGDTIYHPLCGLSGEKWHCLFAILHGSIALVFIKMSKIVCAARKVLCLMCYVFQTKLNVIFYIENAEKLHLLSKISQFNCIYD